MLSSLVNIMIFITFFKISCLIDVTRILLPTQNPIFALDYASLQNTIMIPFIDQAIQPTQPQYLNNIITSSPNSSPTANTFNLGFTALQCETFKGSFPQKIGVRRQDKQIQFFSYNLNTSFVIQLTADNFKFGGDPDTVFYYKQTQTVGYYQIGSYSIMAMSLLDFTFLPSKPSFIDYKNHMVFLYVPELGQLKIYTPALNQINTLRVNSPFPIPTAVIHSLSPSFFIDYNTLNEIYIDELAKFFLITFNQILYIYNLSDLSLLLEVAYQGPIIDVVLCENKLMAVVNKTSPYLYHLNFADGSILEQLILLDNYKYELICSQGEVYLFKVMSPDLGLITITNLDDNSTIQSQTQSNASNSYTPPLSVQNMINFLQSQNTQQFLNLSSSMIPVLSIARVKTVMNFLNFNIDFFWMYAYHENNYSVFMKTFAEDMDLLAELRLKPQILSEIKFSNLFNSSLDVEKYSLPDIRSKHINAPLDIYFLKFMQEYFITGILVPLATFFIMLILKLLIIKIKSQSRIIKAIQFYFLVSTKWWMLLVTIIQNNISYIVFFSFVQLHEIYTFNFIDKINVIVTTIMLFIAVIYSLCFYPLLYRYEKKIFSGDVHEYTKDTVKGFWYLSGFMSLSQFSRSALHAIFIYQNYNLLQSLVILDFLLMSLCLLTYKSFEKKIAYAIIATLTLTMLVFDIILCVIIKSKNQQNIQSFQIALATVITIILALSLVKSLYIFIADNIVLVGKLPCWRGNRVSSIDQSHSKQQVIKENKTKDKHETLDGINMKNKITIIITQKNEDQYQQKMMNNLLKNPTKQIQTYDLGNRIDALDKKIKPLKKTKK